MKNPVRKPTEKPLKRLKKVTHTPMTNLSPELRQMPSEANTLVSCLLNRALPSIDLVYTVAKSRGLLILEICQGFRNTVD